MLIKAHKLVNHKTNKLLGTYHTMWMVMDLLIKLIVIIITLYIHITNQHVVHPEYMQSLFVKYF
jgi:uncharacterized membrane protein